MYKRKLIICVFLLTCLVLLTSGENISNNLKVTNQCYFDIAMEMMKKAKDNSFTCQTVQMEAADCAEVMRNGHNINGEYSVFPKSRVTNGKAVKVYCDMDTDGGGWTLIQRRGNFSRSKDYFFQDWNAYKNGFGDLSKDFWLGNDNIFALTNQKWYSIRFDLKDVEGNKAYALYDAFWIDDEDHKYTLHIKDYSGDAGDSVTSHANFNFSTKDQDNDKHESNCAQTYKGGWWYNACHVSNLNGLYHRGHHESFADGVNWKSWKGYKESLDTTEIKIRPKSFNQNTMNIKTPE